MADEDKKKAAKDSDKLLDVKLVRVVRTTSSESYMIWQDDTRLGQVDVHLGVDLIHATLILEKDLDAAAQAKLIEILDLKPSQPIVAGRQVEQRHGVLRLERQHVVEMGHSFFQLPAEVERRTQIQTSIQP